MQLQCPSCQKLLTVQDQNAGQRLRCPLCSKEFTAPSLPAAGGDPAPAPPPDATYSLAEPEPQAAATPAFASAPPEPAFAAAPLKPPPAPTPPPPAPTPPATTPPSPTTADGYTRTVGVCADPNILQWVPVGAVGLIFLLLIFFTWVGVYPGGVAAVTQSGLQAAFGMRTQDKDVKETFQIVTTREVEDARRDVKEGKEPAKDDIRLLAPVGNEPGVSVLMLFYVLFFVATFVLTAFFVAQPYLTNVKLPPQVDQAVQQLLPRKWLILTGLHAVLLLFLTLQVLLNFSLESTFTTWVSQMDKVNVKGELLSHESKRVEVIRGSFLHWLDRTWVVKAVWLLQLLAAAAAALVYWHERRGADKPLPKLELRW